MTFSRAALAVAAVAALVAPEPASGFSVGPGVGSVQNLHSSARRGVTLPPRRTGESSSTSLSSSYVVKPEMAPCRATQWRKLRTRGPGFGEKVRCLWVVQPSSKARPRLLGGKCRFCFSPPRAPFYWPPSALSRFSGKCNSVSPRPSPPGGLEERTTAQTSIVWCGFIRCGVRCHALCWFMRGLLKRGSQSAAAAEGSTIPRFFFWCSVFLVFGLECTITPQQRSVEATNTKTCKNSPSPCVPPQARGWRVDQRVLHTPSCLSPRLPCCAVFSGGVCPRSTHATQRPFACHCLFMFRAK